ncbi:MAG: RNA polymerase sigma factor [Algoriphagus sp.]|nr:RNA polymerase sigma factor [Algoriphagus sp.]
MDTNHFDTIKRIASGDRGAFRDLYETFKSRVYNTSFSYFQNAEEAEEVTQDVFLEVFRSAWSFKESSSVSTWIYRITVNKCLDGLRHRNRKKRAGFLMSLFKKDTGELKVDVAHFISPERVLENKEKSELLLKSVSQLPESQQTAFILSYIEELPQKEISVIMNVSEKAVESLIQRAKGNLRKKLEIFNPNRRKNN